MDFNLTNNFINEINHVSLLITVISALIHIIFAGAVARDSGHLNKQGHPIFLVSGITWAFATLVGGVIIAAIYWVLHHSKLCKT